MAYSETRIVIGGLVHVPVLIFIANFIKGKFGIKTEEIKDTVVKEEPVKVIELKNTVVKEGKVETLKELSNTFEEWVKMFDSPEIDAFHKTVGLTPLYRGKSLIVDPLSVYESSSNRTYLLDGLPV